MFTSFNTALSALSAHSTAVDVVGNNLANLNTTGYKASVAVFRDLVTQSLGAGLGQTQVGFGVGRPFTIRQFAQGAVRTTNAPLDAAIQGDGFLVVRDRAGATLYTRGGNLQIDERGFLTTVTGQRVQGWARSGTTVDTNSPVQDLAVPVGLIQPPRATTEYSLDLNLDASARPPAGGQFSTSLEVYDSLGERHTVSVRFAKDETAVNRWSYRVEFPASAVDTPITPLEGSLEFGPDGRLTSPGPDDPPPMLQVDGLRNGAAPLQLSWSLFEGTRARITQLSQPSATSAVAQDGAPPAQLLRVGLGDGGVVLAQYSNGQQEIVGQLAMAAVRNPESLIAVGDNNFQVSARSALPAIGLPGTGGRGTIVGGAVEGSTVDIAREFTNLIILQRGYQANAKVVTTADELSQETLNLKR
jgi:flagellar hook protein FlgE